MCIVFGPSHCLISSDCTEGYLQVSHCWPWHFHCAAHSSSSADPVLHSSSAWFMPGINSFWVVADKRRPSEESHGEIFGRGRKSAVLCHTVKAVVGRPLTVLNLSETCYDLWPLISWWTFAQTSFTTVAQTIGMSNGFRVVIRLKKNKTSSLSSWTDLSSHQKGSVKLWTKKRNWRCRLMSRGTREYRCVYAKPWRRQTWRHAKDD